jgi:hypothetical protein
VEWDFLAALGSLQDGARLVLFRFFTGEFSVGEWVPNCASLLQAAARSALPPVAGTWVLLLLLVGVGFMRR